MVCSMGSPVSPIVANLFMEDLEQRTMESASEELRPALWKRSVDDTLEVIEEKWMNGLHTSMIWAPQAALSLHMR